MSYDHKGIDAKWQQRWEDAKIFHAENGSKKEKFYALVEFPFPSGEGLHVGHPRSYTALDVVARKKRMEGKNVLFPMGWDAFGLPTENYAIKMGLPPAVVTKRNVDNFRRQLKSMGFSFDWSREINTTDPACYKWTQWMFLEFFKAGLAYKTKIAINWCPSCKIGLANEEVVAGKCERCGGSVEKREKEQWMIAITKYADRLLEDLKDVNYLPKIKKQQEEWIGRSEGVEIDFALEDGKTVTVFTTRPDTLFGVTYVVLSPEHPLVGEVVKDEQRSAVDAYVAAARKKTDIERGDDTQTKTGVFTGAYAANPVNGEQVPVWIADYVLPHYGTGAVMAVPAHDERDFAFATAYELPVKPVIAKHFIESENPPREGVETIRRKTVHAIVSRKSDGAILMLNWKANQRPDGKFPSTFIIGGVEEGEDGQEAVLREIAEETGLHNVTFVRELPIAIQTEYFAGHKNQNRYADIRVLAFEADGDEAFDVVEEEREKHDPVWVPRDEAGKTGNVVDGPYIWGQYEHTSAMTEKGVLVNSGEFNGKTSDEVLEAIIEKAGGRKKVTYRLRDWVFSRQRYWGEPIPLVHCEEHGWVAVPVEQLPVRLPDVEKYEPTDTGESPLAAIPEFVNTNCPECGGVARRETDTMPNWAGSSWYFLRYLDANNSEAFASPEALKYWMPVDLYNGGMEHTTLHLLYSRFWNKFLFDRGHLPTSEPYARRHSHGLIMAEDGTKMSKSKGNVVNPDEIVQEHGADTLRVYELFMGPFEEPVPWSTNGVIGVRRFLEKTVRLAEKIVEVESPEVTRTLHQVIKKITDDIEGFRFNTAVAALMTFANTVQEHGGISKDSFALFLRILVPFAPHVANELWEQLDMSGFVEQQAWPQADSSLAAEDEVTIAVQVNGKLRGTITMAIDAAEADVVTKARAEENVAKYLFDEPKKIVYVRGKLVNFVV